MSTDTQYLTSTVTEPRRGWYSLTFEDPVLESEFQQVQAERNYPTIRPVLIAITAMILLALIASVMVSNLSWQTAAYTLGVAVPTILATLVASYREGGHSAYQSLLALSAFWIGLICSSVAIRASLNGDPYYFGAEVACVFLVWLVLGLPFAQAAVIAVTLSAVYMWGMTTWRISIAEALFSGGTLLLVNMIGAYCCFKLESVLRQSFATTRKLNLLADRDGLTGLYNRRRYDESIGRVWRQSRRDQSQFTLMLIDIDYFKNFNDVYGHQAGDDALKRVAEVIGIYAQRPLDFAARYGGEEFALVLYGPAHETVRDIPEDLRRAIEDLRIPHARSTASPWLTVSIGVAIISAGNERSLPGAVQLADEALYQAKEEGRNRVVVKESRHSHIQTGRFRADRAQAAQG